MAFRSVEVAVASLVLHLEPLLLPLPLPLALPEPRPGREEAPARRLQDPLVLEQNSWRRSSEPGTPRTFLLRG